MSTRMDHTDVLKVQFEVLKREHSDLDAAISAMQELGRADALQLQRLKKKKLALKDRIAILADRINPDIIA